MPRSFSSFKLMMDPALLTSVRAAAKREDRSVAQWIRRACTQALTTHAPPAPLDATPAPKTAAALRPPLTGVPPPGKTAAQKLAEWENSPTNPAVRK